MNKWRSIGDIYIEGVVKGKDCSDPNSNDDTAHRSLEDLYSGIAGKPVMPRKHLRSSCIGNDVYIEKTNTSSNTINHLL